MSQTNSPRMGPVIQASVITDHIDRVLPHYRAIGLEVTDLGHDHAWPAIRSHRRVLLAMPGQQAWLRLIEIADAGPADPFGQTGWFSLEVGTADVQALAGDLRQAEGFEVLSGPAPLAVSDDIIAMQVRGPAGEIYYFTEIRRELPPFELPLPEARIDRLFIAACTTWSRARSVNFWRSLAGVQAITFRTRIGVLNRGLGLEDDHETPVGTVQLAGKSLIEIDEIPQPENAVRPAIPLSRQGIGLVSVAADRRGLITGPSGEVIELFNSES